MEKAKRTAIRLENIDGKTFTPTMIGEADDLLVLANDAIAYILDDHPNLWGAARTMFTMTLDATQPKSDRFWSIVFRIGKGIICGLAAFGLVCIGIILRARGVM